MKAVFCLLVFVLMGTMNAHANPGKIMNSVMINTMLQKIGHANRTLELPIGNWIIDRSVTIPANVDVKLKIGAAFQIASTATLTIEGDFSAAGLYQIFYGEGKVLFGAGYIHAVYPQWWGKIEGKDDTRACQSVLSSGAQLIRFPPATYAVNAVGENGGADGGLRPESDTTLIFDPGSLLKAITTDKDDYAIINITHKNCVTIDGKAMYALYINNELGEKSGFKNLDIRLKTNLPDNKWFYKGAGPYFGYSNVAFNGEPAVSFADKK